MKPYFFIDSNIWSKSLYIEGDNFKMSENNSLGQNKKVMKC